MKSSTIARIFSRIYEDRLWSDIITDKPIYSGPGSHDPKIVAPYVSAVRSFFESTFSRAPNAVDLGCGDFNVGKQIRSVTDRYIACDIVPRVIEYDRRTYFGEDVDFRVLDLISEELPAGDVVLVRQVLQHLKNHQISCFLPKLCKYKWAIITEHLPCEDPFIPNRDIETGDVRLDVDSGVELTEAPFNLLHYSAIILCEVVVENGRIRTTAYQLQEHGKENR